MSGGRRGRLSAGGAGPALLVAAVVFGLVGLATVGARAGGSGDGRASRPGAPWGMGNVGAQLQTVEPSPPPGAPRVPGPPTSPTPSTPVAPPPERAVAPPSPSGALTGAPAAGGGSVFAGLGTWVDAFDFNPAHSGGNPTVSPADVDRMAAVGVRTLYLQAARSQDPRAPGDVMSPELVGDFLQRAHAWGMLVVAWYLPHLSDVADDGRHLEALARFRAGGQGFDGLALDIEWRAGVPDHATRSARLVELSRHLRSVAGGLPVGAIVMPPVLTDVINTGFWPGFPWKTLAPSYDAWLPMSYWTDRSADSPHRDAYRYTVENVRRIREHLDDPGVAVHAIGGIGNGATPTDYQRFVSACVDTDTVGHSIYDWATTDGDVWPTLR